MYSVHHILKKAIIKMSIKYLYSLIYEETNFANGRLWRHHDHVVFGRCPKQKREFILH